MKATQISPHPRHHMQLSLQIQIQETEALPDRWGAAQPRDAGPVEAADGAGAARGLRADGSGMFTGKGQQVGSAREPWNCVRRALAFRDLPRIPCLAK